MIFNFLIYKGTKENQFKDARYRRLPCNTVDDLWAFFGLDSIFDTETFLEVINDTPNKSFYVYVNPQFEHEYSTNVLYWGTEPDKTARQYWMFLHGIAKV